MITRVRQSYKKNAFGFIVGPLLKIIEAIFDLLIPIIMKAIIDLNQYGEPSLIPNTLSRGLAYFIRYFPFAGTSISDALTGGGIILVMGIVGYVITMTAQYIAAVTSVNVGSEVRSSLYEKILSLSKKDREVIGDSKLLTLINSDSYQHQHGVLLFVRLIIRAPFILLGSLVFSFILDWRVGLAFLAIVPLIVLVNAIILRKSSKQYIEIQKNLDVISNEVSETTEGARVIRASNNIELENKQFNQSTDSYQNKSIRVNRINALINPLTFAITSIVLIVIIYLLKDGLFGGNEETNALNASTIIAEMAYLAQIFFVTVQMTQATIDIVKAMVASKRIDSVLSLDNSVTNPSVSEEYKLDETAPIIKFDNVYFSFNGDDNYFFTNLDFEIRKGETFAIIGGTGSGKSTIAHLIERLYDVNKGEIRFKGVSIKNQNIDVYRHHIGLVNQKSSLFKGTIRSNFLIAKSDATDEEIWEALRKGQAEEFVKKYEDGLDHVVNEGGSNFSGGQKQRLCISRALLKNPELLIFDDSTSALDLLTDKRIREEIAKLKDITKVIISQRVSTIQNADYILVLEGGKVVGLGKHDELMKNCPIYQEIYSTQIKKE